MNRFVFVILVALLVFSVWNWISRRDLKALQKQGIQTLNDSNYYELKYKIQFLIALFSVFVALAGWFGITSIEDVKNQITYDINRSTDSLNLEIIRLEKNIERKDSAVRALDRAISNLSDKQPHLNRTTEIQENRISDIENRIRGIENKNILKETMYVVESIGFKSQGLLAKIYLKELTTKDGQKLPNFLSPPLIIPIADSNVPVYVSNITTESFEVGWNTYGTGPDPLAEPGIIKFSIIIIEK
jgi:hypothetical protein